MNRFIALTGVRGQITSKLTSTLRIGYEIRDPEHGDIGRYHGVVVGGDIVFQPSDRTRVTLVTLRQVDESVFVDNNIYIGTQATLSIEHYLTRKLLLSARVFGANSDYFEKSQKVNGAFDWRTDWVAAGTFSVEYNIQRWLTLGADYTHTRRNSNFDNFDYKDDVVAGRVTLSF